MSNPTFQHRHYKAIAEVIALSRCWHDDDKLNGMINRQELIDDFCRMFQRDNPNFSSDRFADAARGEPSNGHDRPRVSP